ncbi:MAG: HprK-related kinase A [Magnetococcales bacterium]|nr:HprK-related kinase A [Magnetococcales bacterium]
MRSPPAIPKQIGCFADIPEKEIRRAMRSKAGLRWRTGPFIIHLRGDAPNLAAQMRLLYAHHPVLSDSPDEIANFHARLVRGKGMRRWFRPQIQFLAGGPSPLAPFPLDHALPLLEWGVNFCIGSRANHYVILHAAVVARDGQAVILPGTPGSGKSTLAAALSLRGWRILSDEFALISPDSMTITGLARPVALKNSSIEAIRTFEPSATLGPLFPKTRKGTVSHLKPPADSVAQMDLPVPPVLVVFPNYREDAEGAVLTEFPQDESVFVRLAGNAFNYELQGKQGFQTISKLFRSCPAFRLSYRDLDDGVASMNALMRH